MSPFERLLQLNGEHQSCLKGSPERQAKRKVFEDAVYRASHDGSFNDQLPFDGIEAWGSSAWKDQQRYRK